MSRQRKPLESGRYRCRIASSRLIAAAMFISGGPAVVLMMGGGKLPLPGSATDFFTPGTQPDPLEQVVYPIEASTSCSFCHGSFEDMGINPAAEPYNNWVGSMMAQASRDPIFHAALAIANQDIGGGGESCLRCHTPAAWLAGRADPPDGSALGAGAADFDGVTCHLCHRLVDPVYVPEVNPDEDATIIEALAAEGLLPALPGNASYVIDPNDVRRAPRDPGDFQFPIEDDEFPFNPHGGGTPIIVSPFHKKGDLCGTCHDVSNPALTLQKNGTYVLNKPNAAHPTGNKYQMLPEQRTFSEWQQSTFANGGVQMNGRFGGNHPTGIMESCQDCHMPKVVGPGCILFNFPVWQDMPQHSFAGANSWVQRAIYELYPFESGYTDQLLEDAIARNVDMLRDASDLILSQDGSALQVRIINYGGHKLPSGYPEGRRMWINVRFLDENDAHVAERGAYDFVNAELTHEDTKVYEVKFGLDGKMAKLTGLPVGESFHLTLNNTIYKDNRIPPIGFTNKGFAAIQALPVGAKYADGQHWDDTAFEIPPGAAKAVVTVYHQTSSKEYMEFLRDTNTTNGAGQTAYDLWEQFGKSAPVDLDSAIINFTSPLVGDLNDDGSVNGADLGMLLLSWGACVSKAACAADLNDDSFIDGADLGILLLNWTG